MSYNIKNLYDEAINNKELQNYYKFMKPWKNTKKTKRLYFNLYY